MLFVALGSWLVFTCAFLLLVFSEDDQEFAAYLHQEKASLLMFPTLVNLDCRTMYSILPEPVVQRMDNAIHWLEIYLLSSFWATELCCSFPGLLLFSDFFFLFASQVHMVKLNIALSLPQSYWISRTSGNCIFMPLAMGCMKVVFGISSLWSFSSRYCIFAKYEGGAWDTCSLMGGASTAGTANTNLARRKDSAQYINAEVLSC